MGTFAEGAYTVEDLASDSIAAPPINLLTRISMGHSATNSSRWSLRICVAIHFLAVLATAFLGRVDTGFIPFPVEAALLLDWLSLPCMASFLICPSISLRFALRSTLPPVQRLSVSACTVGLFATHFIAFLPMVQ